MIEYLLRAKDSDRYSGRRNAYEAISAFGNSVRGQWSSGSVWFQWELVWILGKCRWAVLCSTHPSFQPHSHLHPPPFACGPFCAWGTTMPLALWVQKHGMTALLPQPLLGSLYTKSSILLSTSHTDTVINGKRPIPRNHWQLFYPEESRSSL